LGTVQCFQDGYLIGASKFQTNVTGASSQASRDGTSDIIQVAKKPRSSEQQHHRNMVVSDIWNTPKNHIKRCFLPMKKTPTSWIGSREKRGDFTCLLSPFNHIFGVAGGDFTGEAVSRGL